MEIVIAAIAVAVLGLGALVAAGRFGGMPDPVRDTYQPPLPEHGVAGADLDGVRFGVTPLGYDMAEVDQLMARMARELDERDAERQPPAARRAADPDDLSAWARE